jgi:mono/diheme cytochrome c family protein
MKRMVSGMTAAVMAAVVAGSVLAAPKKPAAKPDPSLVAAGKKVFETVGCGGCHKVAGKGGAVGPDLSKVGKEHDVAWLTKKIKDPKSVKKDTTMPPFTGKAQDLKAVATYLASLK